MLSFLTSATLNILECVWVLFILLCLVLIFLFFVLLLLYFYCHDTACFPYISQLKHNILGVVSFTVFFKWWLLFCSPLVFKMASSIFPMFQYWVSYFFVCLFVCFVFKSEYVCFSDGMWMFNVGDNKHKRQKHNNEIEFHSFSPGEKAVIKKTTISFRLKIHLFKVFGIKM